MVDKLSSDSANIIKELSHFRQQLQLATEVIKILEQQKTIYQELLAKRQCFCLEPCNNKTLDKDDRLKNLDEQLTKFYSQCYFEYSPTSEKFDEVSLKLLNSLSRQKTATILNTQTNQSIPLSLVDSIPTVSMLGIDMKTFLSNQQDLSLNKKSYKKIRKNHLTNHQNDNLVQKRRKFKCSTGRCRFTSFSERNLIKHQLDEHRRKEFVSIIEPYGFGLSYDNSKITFTDQSRTDLKQCCFPFCDQRFFPEQENDKKLKIDSIIHHFESHLPSYIYHPCYNCLQMFISKTKLDEHFKTNHLCQKYAEFQNHINTNKLTQITELIKCKLCQNFSDSRFYSNRQLFNLHVTMFHSGSNESDLEIVVPISDIDELIDKKNYDDYLNNSVQTDNKKTIFCNLCKQQLNYSPSLTDDDALKQIKRDHIRHCHHNLDDEYFLVDLIDPKTTTTATTIINQSSNDTSKQNPSKLSFLNHIDDFNANIGLEVFIENNGSDAELINHRNTMKLMDDEDVDDVNNGSNGSVSPSSVDDQQLSEYVFNADVDDHTYNIIINESSLVEQEQSTTNPIIIDDHEDYTNKSKDDEISNADSNSQTSNQLPENQQPENEQQNSQYSIMMANFLKNSDDFVFANDSDNQQANSKVMADKVTPMQTLTSKDDTNLKQLMNLYIYECSHCTYSFRTETELSIHNYLVHKIASYHCPHCEFVTQDTGKYHRHEMWHKNMINIQKQTQFIEQSDQNQKSFICSICLESFSSENELRSHSNKNHETFECVICKVITKSRHHLSSHMLSFHRDSIHKCCHCPYKTFNEKLFDEHRKKHEKSHQCPYDGCTDMFGKEDALERHINRFHKKIQPYQCENCEEKFYSGTMLNKHLIAKHNHFLYRCDKCNFKNNNRRKYQLHLVSHTTDKPFHCPESGCFQKFRNQYHLKSHINNKHSKVKEFKCQQKNCERCFKTKSQLKQHEKVHSKTIDSKSEPVPNATGQFSITNKKPNIHYYIFGNFNASVERSNGQQEMFHAKKSIVQNSIKMNQCEQQTNNQSNNTMARSLIIKPALLRPSNISSIPSSSTAILTTTITPVDKIQHDNSSHSL